jgi:hypothetical protein
MHRAVTSATASVSANIVESDDWSIDASHGDRRAVLVMRFGGVSSSAGANPNNAPATSLGARFPTTTRLRPLPRNELVPLQIELAPQLLRQPCRCGDEVDDADLLLAINEALDELAIAVASCNDLVVVGTDATRKRVVVRCSACARTFTVGVGAFASGGVHCGCTPLSAGERIALRSDRHELDRRRQLREWRPER